MIVSPALSFCGWDFLNLFCHTLTNPSGPSSHVEHDLSHLPSTPPNYPASVPLPCFFTRKHETPPAPPHAPFIHHTSTTLHVSPWWIKLCKPSVPHIDSQRRKSHGVLASRRKISPRLPLLLRCTIPGQTRHPYHMFPIVIHLYLSFPYTLRSQKSACIS